MTIVLSLDSVSSGGEIVMAEHYWHNILNWVIVHPMISYLAIFIVALTESLAVVGLLVPGTLLLMSIGAVVGSGGLSWQFTMFFATLGAIIGDGISYWLGRYYQQHIKTYWPLRAHPQLLARGEIFFQCHGGKSVFLGRFVGPIRPIIPLVAGMLNMSVRSFIGVNVLSAVIWSGAYLFPGALLARWLHELVDEGREFAILTALVLGLLWLSFRLSRAILHLNE